MLAIIISMFLSDLRSWCGCSYRCNKSPLKRVSLRLFETLRDRQVSKLGAALRPSQKAMLGAGVRHQRQPEPEHVIAVIFCKSVMTRSTSYRESTSSEWESRYSSLLEKLDVGRPWFFTQLPTLPAAVKLAPLSRVDQVPVVGPQLRGRAVRHHGPVRVCPRGCRLNAARRLQV